MKAALVVLFAIVAVTSASVLPWGVGLNGLGIGALGVPGLGLAGVGLAPWGLQAHGPAAVTVAASPWSHGIHAPIVAAAHAPIVAAAGVPHGAVSVNANRGSVHVAPLPGHIASSSQLNLAPAPGTW